MEVLAVRSEAGAEGRGTEQHEPYEELWQRIISQDPLKGPGTSG
jgi:hypothetical protein